MVVSLYTVTYALFMQALFYNNISTNFRNAVLIMLIITILKIFLMKQWQSYDVTTKVFTMLGITYNIISI